MRDAVQAVEDGSYPKLVERNLPVWHRTGTVLRRDLWKVFPEWKEKFFQNISRQEVDEFLASAAGYPLEANRRLPSMTANDFYHACALGYRAMGYAGTEKPDKEQYLLHADGRDEGLSKLDGNSPDAFDRWLKERPRIGHPWEVCRGGNSTHIDCIVCRMSMVTTCGGRSLRRPGRWRPSTSSSHSIGQTFPYVSAMLRN